MKTYKWHLLLQKDKVCSFVTISEIITEILNGTPELLHGREKHPWITFFFFYSPLNLMDMCCDICLLFLFQIGKIQFPFCDYW